MGTWAAVVAAELRPAVAASSSFASAFASFAAAAGGLPGRQRRVEEEERWGAWQQGDSRGELLRLLEQELGSLGLQEALLVACPGQLPGWESRWDQRTWRERMFGPFGLPAEILGLMWSDRMT